MSTFKVLLWNISASQADLLYGLFSWALIIGAFAVFVGTIGSITMETAKEYFSNERLATNEAATERAKADAEIAREGAAKANARAAEAELELARFRASRTLTSEQQERMVSMLKPFAGTKFDFALVQGEAESADLMLQLETTLQTAGWAETDWVAGDSIVMRRAGKPTVGLTAVGDVRVVVRPDGGSVLAAAAALVAALNAAGLAVKDGRTPADFINQDPEVVHILIGRKT